MRSKDNTIEALEAQLDKLLSGAPSTLAAMSTETGVKDKYFQHFVDELSDACAKLKDLQQSNPSLKGCDYLTAKLKELRDTMPMDLFSPTLRLDGASINFQSHFVLVIISHIDFDPNTDTPVEILHVVLLGFVKYFWCDTISHMNDAQKEILTTRLSLVDVTGLGIPPLAGKTLVKYAGSLTGRDFRAIAQTAPFVLYDLVP